VKSLVVEMGYVKIGMMDKYWVCSTVLVSGVMMERLMESTMAAEVINLMVHLMDKARVIRTAWQMVSSSRVGLME